MGRRESDTLDEVKSRGGDVMGLGRGRPSLPDTSSRRGSTFCPPEGGTTRSRGGRAPKDLVRRGRGSGEEARVKP